MSNKIRILVADDHSIVRMGLVSLLETKDDLEVVGEAGNGETAVTKALKLTPDVVIMDLMMPKMGGAEATKAIHAQNPAIKVLILTSFGTSDEISRALDAGASGAIMKSATNGELVSAIRTVAAGKRVIANDIRRQSQGNPLTPSLTPRQLEVLNSVSRGFTNREIADQFGISPESVKTHLENIFARIGASSRSEAVAIALRNQLLKI